MMAEFSTADLRLGEEIKRKFLARLRAAHREECDVCHQSFDLRAIIILGSRFVCRECREDAIPSEVEVLRNRVRDFPNCPVLWTNGVG